MKLLLAIFLSVLTFSPTFAQTQKNHYAGEVVVYSARNEHLIEPVFKRFTEETGIKVKYITDGAAPLTQRLKGEGDKTPADLLITVDAGNLWQAAREGVLQPASSPELKKNIPDHLKDPKNRWFGLSVRARTIAYSTKKVKPSDLSTYEDLGNSKWKGRLCLRTAKKVYNQSLVAMFIAEHGKKETESIIRKWVANLAAPVFSSDTDVLKAIAAGQCDVGVVNTYYFGRLKREKPDLHVALFWPNQKGSGVHVNVSGAGITKYAPHKDQALKLLTWLSSPTAQKLFADVNLEYPANPKVEPAAEVKSWGGFKPNLINVTKAGELQADAIKLMDRAGYK